jgi:TonB-linked SusC/RagA family outer membrane protein
MKKKVHVLGILFLVLIFSTALPAMAQNIQISGTVTDASTGQSLPGVSVSVKKTTSGTVTDLKGNYSISVKPGSILVFSYVGYQSQTFVVNQQKTINVELKSSTTGLNEVVVVGYGTQQKKLITGATVSETGAQLMKRNTTNALQAMQGQTAGVNITPSSGQPGGGMKVNIRGVGTIGNSGPLYVVDGVITGDISYLDPSDIKSIDILKDAASCAIYGINGANGVVLITTKGGTIGPNGEEAPKSHISFDYYTGWQNVPRKLNVLNSKEYATIMNEEAVNSGAPLFFTQDQINAMGPGTDWMNIMFAKNVPTQNLSVTASGGTSVSAYTLAFSHTEQGGILGGSNLSNYERYNFRMNSERKMYGNFMRIGEHLTYSHVNQRGVADGGIYGNSLRGAITTSPFLAMYDSTGQYLNSSNSTFYKGGPWNNNEANPYALMALTNQHRNQYDKLLGDVYAEINPVKGLKLKSTFGFEYDGSKSHSYTPVYDLSLYAFTTDPTVSQNLSSSYTWNWDNTANYIFNVKKNHFDVLVGSSIRKSQGSWMYGSNSGTMLFNSLFYGYLSDAAITSFTATYPDSTALKNSISLSGEANSVVAHASFFGRINYDYKQTFLATAVFRYDGSTNFAPGHQWAAFPSFSAGWVMTNEDFMKPFKKWLDFFKLRGSWGVNGNDAIAMFQYESLIGLTNATYNIGGSDVPGSYPQTIGNPALKWETSHQLDFGFDAGLFNDKVTASFDWYNKDTKNWLVQAPLLATAGVSTPPYINGGNVINKGVEVQVTYNDRIGTDFRFSITGTYTYNKNDVTDVPTEDGIIHGPTNSLYVNAPEFYRAQSGYPIGYFWGYKTDGVFQNWAQIEAYKNGNGQLIQPNAQPGDLKFVDVNGDGMISAADKTNLGDPNPHNLFGASFSCSYKGLDFSIEASGVSGNKIAQAYGSGGYANWTTAILNRWHGDGTSNFLPRVTINNSNWSEFSDIYLQNGAYLRVTNITLGYDFAKLIKFKYMSKCRVYLAANNIFTFTKYDGMDPAVGYTASGQGNYSFGQGVDVGFYPTPKTYLIGLNVNF